MKGSTNITQCCTDLCKLCEENGAVFPCFEAFVMGIEMPSVYFLFYEYIFKASVGDIRWKRSCAEKNDKSALLGSTLAEAFAMIQLKNNYFAWLLEAKEGLDNLVTDYDPPAKRSGMKTAQDLFLKKVHLNIKGGDDEDLLVAEGTIKFDELKKRDDEMVKLNRRNAAGNETYKDLRKALAEMQGGDDGDQDDGDDYIYQEGKKRENQRKRRKILKPFREYTVQQGSEGKFKGWSMRAASDLATMSKKLKEDNEALPRFRAAYRELYRLRHQKRKRQECKQDKEEVEYDHVWDLGEVLPVEI
jgi:hypothetical protein